MKVGDEGMKDVGTPTTDEQGVIENREPISILSGGNTDAF
jgi:hypothetical protein